MRCFAMRLALLVAAGVLLPAQLAMGQPAATAPYGNIGQTLLYGAGPAHTSLAMTRAFKIFESLSASPVTITYRNVTSDTARADFVADVPTTSSSTKMHFAVHEGPLSAAQFTSANGIAGVLQLPLFVTQYGIYYNVPGNRATPLNMTSCLVIKMFLGTVQTWKSPDVTDLNKAFVNTDPTGTLQTNVQVLYEDSTSGGSQAVNEWLSASAASCSLTWSNTFGGSARKINATTANYAMELMKTPYSIGYLPTSVGRAMGLTEAMILNGGSYVLSTATNTTNLRKALETVLPTSFNGDMDGKTIVNLASASSVHPLLRMTYITTRKDWTKAANPASDLLRTREKQAGAAMQALLTYLNSDAFQTSSILSENNLVGPGSTITARVTAAITPGAAGGTVMTITDGHTTDPTAFTAGDGTGLDAVSPKRVRYDYSYVEALQSQINSLKAQLVTGAARQLKGSGSSAVSAFLWRLMGAMAARSATPVSMVYRATGSGTGAKEFVGADNSYNSYIDFGASDTPLGTTDFAALSTANKAIAHVPILLAPMNFFVNFADSEMQNRTIKLSACTIAKVMQADIKTWADPAVTADNGYALPDKPITIFYRQGSSGTTQVITQYLKTACADWRLGSSGTLSNWPANAQGTANAAAMAAAVKNTTYSIGYMDVGYGLDVNLIEVNVKNKDGNFVTSQTGDVPAAASSLFKTDAWPKQPTSTFAAVALLDQPGAITFPIVAMPFMFVRLDMTSRGDAGPLLVAFVTFMLSEEAQSTFLPQLYLNPLPAEVRQYALQRALPLIQVDTRARAWTFESGTASAGKGAGDNVFSAFGDSFSNYQGGQFLAFQAAYNKAQNNKGNATVVVAAGNGTADVPANLKAQLADMNDKIEILQSLAIAGIIFGAFGLALGVVSSLRMLVKHSLWPGSNNANNNAVSGREGSFNHSLSQSTTMSVRRKTLSTVSDTSMT